MRWFINSTKETSGFNDNNNFQAQIDVQNTNIDAHHARLNAQRIDLQTLKENTDFQLGNIKSVIDKQTSRIEELEKGMDKFKELFKAAFNTITDLDNKVKALENQSMPQQSISEVKAKESQIRIPKFRRMKNTYSDTRYAASYAIAHGYTKAGFNQVQIAGKLNALGHRTPKGMEFTERHVTDLMCNPFQKARFMEGKEKKAKL